MLTRVVSAPPPHEAHARLAKAYATTFLLESREGPERIARYSILGWDPAGTIILDQKGIHTDGALPAPERGQDPLEYLRRIQTFYATPERVAPFVGGLVGCIGYDFVRHVEPTLARDSAEPWPRLLFGLYLDGLVYDHQTGITTYVSRGEDRSAALQALLQAPLAGPPSLQVGTVTSSVDEQAFGDRVQRARDLILAGEAFQIVLSRAFTAPYQGSLMPLYQRLREAAAVPYLYHLRFGGDAPRTLLGASPEGLVRVRQGTVETFPIAGTRPLTGDADLDRQAGQELLADRKETAEHAMLVDLARNDIGRVATQGSVRVQAFQELHAFRSVQHMVSHVTGRLQDDADAWSALQAVFPAGTVSGAPKVRAMEHIDALESQSRGPYAGAVCYASFNGDFDSCITIRSLSAQDGGLTVQAGAGIVHRSDPRSEWLETRHKADTILAALAAFGAEVPP